ncbi:hypothetical protein N8703_03455, partial [Verrucomicrobia bacterium]|nr:hypothetical protein [Verrucomicrobiota bacterium]
VFNIIRLGAAYSIVPRDSWQLNDVECWPGHDEPPVAVRLLIAKGADVIAKNVLDETPLDQADDKETADLLRKHGAKTTEELKAVGK